MNTFNTLVEEAGKRSGFWRSDPDRIGVAASILCAAHCAVTPLFLLFAPAFGRVWSHPASHWLVALLVVPLAAVMIRQGFRSHRRLWVVACGFLGMTLVTAGAVIPYLSLGETPGAPDPTPLHELPDATGGEEEFVYVVGEEEDGEAAPCPDACCPSLGTDAEGKLRLHLPLASIVTTLGGLALIATHLGNLCCCRNACLAGDSPGGSIL